MGCKTAQCSKKNKSGKEWQTKTGVTSSSHGVRLTLLETNLSFFSLRDTDRPREPDSTDFLASQPLK